MTDKPKPSPIKVGDVLLIVRHPDDSAPIEFDVNHVGTKWANGNAGFFNDPVRGKWRINIHTMQVDTSNGVHGPADFVVLRNWEEWDALKAKRGERSSAREAYSELRHDLDVYWHCPEGVTAANIQAARALLGLSDRGGE